MDPKLFKEGVPVLMIAGLASTAIEAQVVRCTECDEAREAADLKKPFKEER